MNGWVSLHRKMLDNPVVCKDSDYMAIWIYLLLNATHAEIPAMFKGQKIMLNPGQLITGRKAISDKLRVTESKVQRVLKCYESERQIEQQTGNKNRLITIKNWDMYQCSEQQIERQMNNQRTTNEQQMNTNNNVNNKINILCSPEVEPETIFNNGALDTERIHDVSKMEAQVSIELDNNILCSPGAEPDKTGDNNSDLEQLKTDFEKIYAIYPKKRGKAKAFEYYCAYVKKGRCINKVRYRLTNKQVYLAVRAYTHEREEEGTELDYYKNFDTFMSKAIIDYLPGEDDL